MFYIKEIFFIIIINIFCFSLSAVFSGNLKTILLGIIDFNMSLTKKEEIGTIPLANITIWMMTIISCFYNCLISWA